MVSWSESLKVKSLDHFLVEIEVDNLVMMSVDKMVEKKAVPLAELKETIWDDLSVEG
jgi:hypothetical protein